ncbi:hypothetical protein BRCH_02126c [Candidatus Burkholderia brachyanthoides]|nr:hypothetical protein BRCH_02126c [Candidatus Burkholderia brachyanthoides]
MQRSLLEFVAAEVDRSRSELRAELDIANQANADLILESERRSLIVENLTASLEAVHGERAELAGRLAQMEKEEKERDAAREEAAAERVAAELARMDLAKLLLRLEAMPRLEKDLDDARSELESERSVRVSAEQSAAVALAKLEASLEARQAIERTLEQSRRRGQERDADLASVRVELKESHAAADTLRTELLAVVKPRARGPRNTPKVRKKGTTS